MSIIQLETTIKSPIEICFDLSRSVELHILSTAHTKEVAVAGRKSGLCNLGDTVTWRARHFGIFQNLTVVITDLDSPNYFEDKMVRGAFKSFTHKHYFQVKDDETIMQDHFDYQVPYGIFGAFFNKVILYKYMRNLLVTRNSTIKHMAETGEWQKIL